MNKGSNDHRILALLEKWQTGDFNRFDEQELRRLLAEADPFLRDAVEGLLAHPEADHTAIVQRLRRRIRPVAAPAPERRVLWWAAAAALLVLAVASWWISRPDEPPLLAADKTPAASDSPRAAAPAPDTLETTADKAPLLAVQQDRQRSALREPVPEPFKSTPATVAATDDVAANQSGASPQEALVEIPVATAPGKSAEAEELSSSKVASDPIVAAPPAAPRTAKDQAGASEQKAETAKKRKITPPPSGPVPAGGWDRFRRDMRNQLILPQSAKDKGVGTLTVTLVLEITPGTGQIRSVVFVQRAGYGCDEAAERFVHQYNWITMPDGPNEVEVELIFR